MNVLSVYWVMGQKFAIERFEHDDQSIIRIREFLCTRCKILYRQRRSTGDSSHRISPKVSGIHFSICNLFQRLPVKTMLLSVTCYWHNPKKGNLVFIYCQCLGDVSVSSTNYLLISICTLKEFPRVRNDITDY
jgi:hypothetical protein